jgi:hypothetical protein
MNSYTTNILNINNYNVLNLTNINKTSSNQEYNSTKFNIKERDSTKFNQAHTVREWDFWDYALLICVILGFFTNSLSIIVMRDKNLRKKNAALFVIIYLTIIKI